MNGLLIVIGASLFALSVALILTGSFYSKKTVSESATKYKKVGRGRYAVIPLRLQFDSEVQGEISVTTGELQFSIEDFFGWIPQTPIEWVSPAYVRWSGHGKHNFKGTFNAGDYMFMIKTKAEEVDAKIEYTVTYYIPKLKRLVDLGLAFVEVSVPLLVTGLVL
jgi:hypothetical protein